MRVLFQRAYKREGSDCLIIKKLILTEITGMALWQVHIYARFIGIGSHTTTCSYEFNSLEEAMQTFERKCNYEKQGAIELLEERITLEDI